MRELTDGFGRQFKYLRLSVTDACNFRCAYCLPDGFERKEREAELSVPEITNLVGAFAGMGFSKVRVTGGEPTLRSDIVEIVAAVAGVSGVSKVALSSNGYRLSPLLPELRRAGLAALNVSVDSLDPARFARITGRDKLHEALESVQVALSLGIEMKVNCVMLAGLNDADVEPLIDWTRAVPLTVRFIELMETGEGRSFFEAHHVGSAALLRLLEERGWRPVARSECDGPALELSHPRHAGRVGIIAPYSKDFCVTCNRLRVDSRGRVKLCLFGDGSTSLRSLLRSESQREELQETVRALLGGKTVSHALAERRTGSTSSLSIIGG